MVDTNILQIVRILSLTSIAFVITVLWTPALTHFLYKYKLGKQIRDSVSAPIFSKLHKHKAGTPTMGGVLIWGTTLFLLAAFVLLSKIFPDSVIFSYFNFLNRGETYLPIAALAAAAVIGLLDDIFGIWKIGPKGGGLRMKHRLFLYSIVAVTGAWWFYFKLDWTTIHAPFIGDFDIGLWYIPFFIFVFVFCNF